LRSKVSNGVSYSSERRIVQLDVADAVLIAQRQARLAWRSQQG
jgi:hypothetical protein